MNTELTVSKGGTSLAPLAEITAAAKLIAQGGLFGLNENQAATLMLVAQSEGLHYMQALKKYHVINGKPSEKAESMLSAYQTAGGKIKWVKRTDSEVIAVFSHPSSGEIEVKWDDERVKKAGLGGNHNKYPLQMKAARCISEGVKASFPACLSGFYTPEEVGDFEPAPKQEAKETAPAPQKPAPIAQEAEIVPETAPAAAKPDYSVNILGDKPNGLTEEELKNLCGWIKALPDQNKAMAIVKKYCKLSEMKNITQAQADKLAVELTNAFTPNGEEF